MSKEILGIVDLKVKTDHKAGVGRDCDSCHCKCHCDNCGCDCGCGIGGDTCRKEPRRKIKL